MVPRGAAPLELYVQAQGFAPYQGEVVPDRDRELNIALLPAGQISETPPPPPPTKKPKERVHSRRHHR